MIFKSANVLHFKQIIANTPDFVNIAMITGKKALNNYDYFVICGVLCIFISSAEFLVIVP